MSSNRFDVIIFGASGYTGKQAVIKAIEVLKGLKWGVAGRNKTKLELMLKEIGQNTPIFIADVDDHQSLVRMAKRAKIIVNCCGPYRHFGEQVVKACIEAGASHVDVTCELQYMEKIQLKYNNQAREKGVYVVPACGFDYIPSEMGTIFLQDKFDGTVNSVEIYLHFFATNDYKLSGAGIHYGTWESIIQSLANEDELQDLKNELSSYHRFEPKLKNRLLLHKSRHVGNRWCIPYLGLDRTVVTKSQLNFFNKTNQRPAQVRTYLAFDTFFDVAKVVFVALIVGVLSKFAFGKNLLLNHPKLFSLGFASHEGPSEKTNKNSNFEMIFHGQGWTEKLVNPTDSFPTNKKLTTRVAANSPGYSGTCVSLLLAARTILEENVNMPDAGGVFQPAVAFKHTSLISSLQKHGYTFEVLKKNEDHESETNFQSFFKI